MPTVGTMMTAAAALMNDPAQATYTNAVLLPYAQIAWRRFIGKVYANDIPVVDEISATIVYIALARTISKPSDLVFPVTVFERDLGSTDDGAWKELDQNAWDEEAEPALTLDNWVWREQDIVVPSVSRNRDVLLKYKKSLEASLVDANTTIPINLSQSWMEHMTASYASRYVGNNPSRADSLEGQAGEILEDFLSPNVKANQRKQARRKPYRLGR